MAINKKLIATGGDTSIVASDYFKIKLYTGNYSTSRNITGHNFRPALVWIKNRDQNDPHMIYDSTRGVNKFIAFNSGANEASDTNQLLAFLSNGFRIGDDARVNTSNEDYIAYSFKANSGSTNSNTDGSITSTVQTSVESGFSIIKYTGNGAAGATVGHGLDLAPELIILKGLESFDDWAVGVTGIGWTKYLGINTQDAAAVDDRWWDDTAPTNSVFTLGDRLIVNYNNKDFIAYAFHSVEGFSKIGTYTGNGSSNGPTITTGFKPSFIMVKCTSHSTTNWVLMDSVRDAGRNDGWYTRFEVNDSVAETDDYSSNKRYQVSDTGFQLTTASNSWNGSGRTYMFLTFAE